MAEPEGRRDAFLAALESSACGIAVFDASGQFIDANAAYCELSGIPLARLKTLTFREMQPPELKEIAEATFMKLASGELPNVHSERHYVRPDGRAIWVEIMSSGLESPHGRRVVSSVVDVTSRHLAQQDAQRLKQQDEVILNAITEGILTLNAEGKITFVNEPTARVLGYKPAEMLGKDHHALMHHSRSPGVAYPEARCPIHRTLADGSVHHASGENFWTKDGRAIPVEYTSAPIREDGKHAGAIIIFADVSDRTQAEAIAHRANARVLEIYEKLPEAFFALDREFRLVYMNPVAEKMRSTPKERVMGQVLWEAFPDLVGTKYESEYKRAMRERTSVTVQEYYERMNRWFEATAHPTDDGLSIFFRDITDRKRAEDEARVSAISRPLARRILQELVEGGNVAHQILQQVGRKLAGENPVSTMPEALAAFTQMGLGQITLDRAEGGRFEFTGSDLLEHRPGSRVATCSFTLGYLSGIVSRSHDDTTSLGTEIECQSRGAPRCRFIVQLRRAEDPLAKRVKELI